MYRTTRNNICIRYRLRWYKRGCCMGLCKSIVFKISFTYAFNST